MGPVPQINEFNYIWRKWLSLLSDAIYCPKVTVVEDSDMSNSWVNNDTTRKVRYWKDAFGVVHLSGLIKTGTINNAAFTLPAGYRPAYVDSTNQDLQFAAGSNDLYGQLQVNYLGVVTPRVGSNTWFALDGITFKAA